jgi:hypothetical protein
MPRLIPDQTRFTADGITPRTATGQEKLEDYLVRIARYVPVEIVLAYLTIQSIFQAATGANAAPRVVEFVFYALLVIATAPYLIRFGGAVPHKMRQAIIGTISFVVWTYGIGGTFFWGALEQTLHTRVLYPSIAGATVVLWSVATGFIRSETE